MDNSQTLPAYPRGLDFEQVWAALMENRELQKETDRQLKETARELREAQKETDRQLKETDRQLKETDRQLKETDRIVKETSKQIGTINNRFGEIVEYMVAPNLREKFRKLGLNFPKANPNADVSDYDNDIFFEIDVMLENGDKALLVETKATLTTEDVKDHVARLEKMRKYAGLHCDKRIFLGAVAGIVMTSNVKKYAFKQGFYVIEPSGESFNITPPTGKPKEW